MNDKERLEEIRENFKLINDFAELCQTGICKLPLKDYDWLIRQAESRQRCNEAFTYMSKTCDYWYEKAKQFEKNFDRLKQLGDPRYWGCVELDTFDEIMEASKDGKGEEDRG
jgi:hypothetical protein